MLLAAGFIEMRLLRIASLAIGWALLLGALGIGAGPNGPLRTRYVDWRAKREMARTLQAHWSELSRTVGRVGRADSTPRVIEFLDYGCGYCRQLHGPLHAFLASTPRASLGVRYLSTQPDSVYRVAAAAAVCAANEGAFQEIHVFLMTDTSWIRGPDWESIGRRVGIDQVVEWEACMRSTKTRALLARDSVYAEMLDLPGTPSFVTRDGDLFAGTLPPPRSFLPSPISRND